MLPSQRRRQITPGQLSLGLEADPIAIRTLLAAALRSLEPEITLVPEMGLCLGAARIDLAAIGRSLEGYEIKADRDDLDRLPDQARRYGRVFDRLTLVTTDRHLAGAERLLPDWWGLMVVRPESEMIRALRPPRQNPGADPLALAQLLWRDEALDALERRTGARPATTRLKAWQHLAAATPPEELRALVCCSLRERTDWRAAG